MIHNLIVLAQAGTHFHRFNLIVLTADTPDMITDRLALAVAREFDRDSNLLQEAYADGQLTLFDNEVDA